jgi:hypothetical protein
MHDWDAFETKLLAASIDAINRFADEHPDESICFFAFDSEPRYGYVLFAFDTFEKNIRSAQQMEQYTMKDRTEWLTKKRYWNGAKHHLCHPPVTVFNTNSGDFAFPQYAEVRFPEWEGIAKDGGTQSSMNMTTITWIRMCAFCSGTQHNVSSPKVLSRPSEWLARS